MAFVTVRASPALRNPCAGSSSRPARPVRVQPITVRCRPLFSRPRAFYRPQGPCDGASAEAVKAMMDEMAKQWRGQAPAGGAFNWPGGRTRSGYVYGSGRCRPANNTAAPSSQQQKATPELPLDVADSPEGFYTIIADVPGLSKPDLSIKLSKERVLTISGERKAPFSTDSSAEATAAASYRQLERAFGGFERRWQLPADAESEGISAKVADGVLTITVPKKQPEPEVDDAQDIFIA